MFCEKPKAISTCKFHTRVLQTFENIALKITRVLNESSYSD